MARRRINFISDELKSWIIAHIKAIVLLAALVHGIVYVFLIPPWQHYDEPGHFEYAWLVANRPTWPKVGDYDQSMRREVAASMVENGFFNNLGFTPNLIAQDEPVWIGISQIGDPPIYYFLASLPLRLLRYTDITLQLYAARLVSLALFCFFIVCLWGVTREVVLPGSPLLWMVPIGIILLPGFVDLMTAVNDDVGGIAFFTFFLWGCLRIIKKGITLPRLAWVAIGAGLCLFTKNNVYVAIPLGVVAVLFGLFRDRFRVIAWGAVIFAAAFFAGFLVQWGNRPAFFYQNVDQILPVRIATNVVAKEGHAIQITVGPDRQAAQLTQIIPHEYVEKLDGKAYTLGAWMWADHPVRTVLPVLTMDDQPVASGDRWVTLTDKPVFYAVTGQFPASDHLTLLVIQPQVDPVVNQTTIYYMGLILTNGVQPLDSAPIFDNPSAQVGIWVGEHFENYIRNGNANAAWPAFRSGMASLLEKYYPAKPDHLWFFLDFQATKGYFRQTVSVLYHTFWAKFGWAQIPLLWNSVYQVLIWVTLIGLLGFIGSLIMLRQQMRLDHWFFIVFVMVSVWGMTLLRGADSIFGRAFYPAARYAFPAIFPTMLILCMGWYGISMILNKVLKLPGWVWGLLFVVFFISLDILSVISINTFFYRS